MAHRSRRMHLVGPGLLLIAAGAVAAAHSSDPLPVNIAGKQTAHVARAAGKPDAGQKVTKTEKPALVVNGPLTGDAGLRGALDLGRAEIEDGRYVVPLGNGLRAVLTLDPVIQEAAEETLARAKAPRGAVVVMAVDGRILALAGMRDGNPGPARDAGLALDAWAPAASIFKIVTAAALIDAGVRPGSKVCYHGGFRSVEASNLTDNKARDDACGDLTDGLAKSQNAIIAKLAHRHVSPAVLRAKAAAFGFNRALPFALEAESGRAEIPSAALDFARVSAGFWHTELSPVGGAVLANTVAAGGMAVTPRIVEAVIKNGAPLPVEPVPAKRVLSESVASDLTRMMVATTETGTAVKGFRDPAGRKFLPDMQVAGKTGTLQRTAPSYLEYSWFVGFAPSDAPKVSISVLLGNPPRWHLKAHTAARMVLQKVF